MALLQGVAQPGYVLSVENESVGRRLFQRGNLLSDLVNVILRRLLHAEKIALRSFLLIQCVLVSFNVAVALRHRLLGGDERVVQSLQSSIRLGALTSLCVQGSLNLRLHI